MTVGSDTTPTTPANNPASILDHFANLPDPRREQGRIHRLDEIVFIATCAVFCGADTWVQIADYAHSKHDWLETFLTLPGGIPSHDTFRRVFCLLDPAAFQKGFSAWITALMARRGLTPLAMAPPELTPIAIDGKAQRGSARRTVGRSALHVVSAWSVENHLTLGQVATGAKSNEITAIPELLELLDLNGAVVTIDAMGCQKEIAAGILGPGPQGPLDPQGRLGGRLAPRSRPPRCCPGQDGRGSTEDVRAAGGRREGPGFRNRERLPRILARVARGDCPAAGTISGAGSAVLPGGPHDGSRGPSARLSEGARPVPVGTREGAVASRSDPTGAGLAGGLARSGDGGGPGEDRFAGGPVRGDSPCLLSFHGGTGFGGRPHHGN
jgi:hypothetical protein